MSAKEHRKVLVAMDGSDHSVYAFDWYMDTVHRPDNEVIIVHCPDYSALTHSPVMSSDPSLVAQLIKKEEQQINIIIAKLKEKLAGSGIKGRILRLTGDAGHAIVKAALAEHVDVIVTGTRGQGKVRRTLLGSVSDYIIHHSNVPVLICKKPHDGTEEKQ
ncbi:universal stress protein YxiE-like [Haliotis rubra]|uniref:universal stress protein YxiE-like n=1 Tax=Haliotis rubra TaxID=36100 RepID=UPI001EE5092B|nr:universal stress protein YxiE-like [Haliotis rubra]